MTQQKEPCPICADTGKSFGKLCSCKTEVGQVHPNSALPSIPFPTQEQVNVAIQAGRDDIMLRQAIRKVLKFHKLTVHGDNVVEADLADAVVKVLAAK